MQDIYVHVLSHLPMETIICNLHYRLTTTKHLSHPDVLSVIGHRYRLPVSTSFTELLEYYDAKFITPRSCKLIHQHLGYYAYLGMLDECKAIIDNYEYRNALTYELVKFAVLGKQYQLLHDIVRGDDDYKYLVCTHVGLTDIPQLNAISLNHCHPMELDYEDEDEIPTLDDGLSYDPAIVNYTLRDGLGVFDGGSLTHTNYNLLELQSLLNCAAMGNNHTVVRSLRDLITTKYPDQHTVCVLWHISCFHPSGYYISSERLRCV